MKIRINSIEFDVPNDCSLTQAIAIWLEKSVINQESKNTQIDANEYVVALNQTFISRTLYDTITLNTDDDVELLTPMSGG